MVRALEITVIDRVAIIADHLHGGLRALGASGLPYGESEGDAVAVVGDGLAADAEGLDIGDGLGDGDAAGLAGDAVAVGVAGACPPDPQAARRSTRITLNANQWR